MKKIIFVDDQPNILQGLKRMLRHMRNEWEMAFAGSGKEALAIMARESFDVIVSDMRMPGMDGTQLLAEVMKKHPHTIRIVLSGHSDPVVTMRSVGVTHQFLSKPCDPDQLKHTVVRACALRNIFNGKDLKEMVSQMESLPSLPSLYIELLNALDSPNPSIEKVAKVISKDVAMTVRILQLVNSAFFGLCRNVSSPTQAVTFLGLETIKALVLTVKVFSQFDIQNMKNFSIEEYWRHSMLVGARAKEIARLQESEQLMIESTFMAGLLHDVGKLVLATNLSGKYDEVMGLSCQTGVPIERVELEKFGATHAELGSYLLGIWGLPDQIVEAVAFHHNPVKCPELSFLPLTAVHVANALEHEGHSKEEIHSTVKLDHDYLEGIGLERQLSKWHSLWNKMKEKEIQ